MFYSINAQFHISFIPQRWYNSNKYNTEQHNKPIYQIVQPQGPKQKYGFGMGYAKKALDLAIRVDKVDEFVNQLEYFIESVKAKLFDQQENNISMHIGDLLRVRYKGQQPNRYKS